MNRILRSTAALLLLASLSPAWGASCQISTSDLMFASYRFNSDSDIDSSATISITNCVDDGSGTDVSYSIAISAGGSGTFVDRTMNGPAGALHYNVYADGGYTMVWGDASSGTVVSGNFSLPGTTSASHTAYARIPAHQTDIMAGHYADQLTISIEY